MDIRERYTQEMDSVRFSESFERDTAALMRRAASGAKSAKGEYAVKRKKIIKIAAAAAAFILLLTGSVYAARALLTPSEVAKRVGEDGIAEAFASDGAVTIGETQTFGEYLITLEGIAGGEALEDHYFGIDNSLIGKQRCYAVFSLERADGTPMPDSCNDGLPFMLSPIVNGIEPWRLSVFNLDASMIQTSYDGTRYILLDTASLELFADRGVRIAAYDGVAPSSEIFAVLSDGTTDFCESYAGGRAMFDLPLDKSKADPDAVQAMLDNDTAEGQYPVAYSFSYNSDTNEAFIDFPYVSGPYVVDPRHDLTMYGAVEVNDDGAYLAATVSESDADQTYSIFAKADETNRTEVRP